MHHLSSEQITIKRIIKTSKELITFHVLRVNTRSAITDDIALKQIIALARR